MCMSVTIGQGTVQAYLYMYHPYNHTCIEFPPSPTHIQYKRNVKHLKYHTCLLSTKAHKNFKAQLEACMIYNLLLMDQLMLSASITDIN